MQGEASVYRESYLPMCYIDTIRLVRLELLEVVWSHNIRLYSLCSPRKFAERKPSC